MYTAKLHKSLFTFIIELELYVVEFSPCENISYMYIFVQQGLSKMLGLV